MFKVQIDVKHQQMFLNIQNFLLVSKFPQAISTPQI